MYDREHSKIGFWKTNCSELWERLQITSAPLPVPSSSNRKNSSAELPPSEPPNYVLPGNVHCSSSSELYIIFYLALLDKYIFFNTLCRFQSERPFYWVSCISSCGRS